MNNVLKIGIIITACFLLIMVLGIGYVVYLGLPKKPIIMSEGIKVACIGDSITFGMGVMFDHRNVNSYPAQLQSLIWEEYQVLNYGVCGATLLKAGDRPYWNQKSFTYSKESNPDIVLIMLGTNDSKPNNWNAINYEAQLREMVGIYQKLPSKPRICLMTNCATFVLDGKDKVKSDIDANVIENEIVRIIKCVAEEINLSVIDIFSATKGHPEYFTDGVHPNAVGNKVLAETVYFSMANNAS